MELLLNIKKEVIDLSDQNHTIVILNSNDISIFESSEKRTLSDLGIGKKSGAKILAIKEDQKLLTNPGGNFVLQPAQVLIAFGSKEQLDNLSGLLGELVSSADFLR